MFSDVSYQGGVPARTVVQVVEELVDMACIDLSLGDTAGVGTALQARSVTSSVAERIRIERVAVHFS